MRHIPTLQQSVLAAKLRQISHQLDVAIAMTIACPAIYCVPVMTFQ